VENIKPAPAQTFDLDQRQDAGQAARKAKGSGQDSLAMRLAHAQTFP